jgi:hypothetical protein
MKKINTNSPYSGLLNHCVLFSMIICLIIGGVGCRKSSPPKVMGPRAALQEATALAKSLRDGDTFASEVRYAQVDAAFYQDALDSAKQAYENEQQSNLQSNEVIGRALRHNKDNPGDELRIQQKRTEGTSLGNYQEFVLYVAHHQISHKDSGFKTTLAPLITEVRRSHNEALLRGLAQIFALSGDAEAARQIITLSDNPGVQIMVCVDIAHVQAATLDFAAAHATLNEAHKIASHLDKTQRSQLDLGISELEVLINRTAPTSASNEGEDDDILARPSYLSDQFNRQLASGKIEEAKWTLEEIRRLAKEQGQGLGKTQDGLENKPDLIYLSLANRVIAGNIDSLRSDTKGLQKINSVQAARVLLPRCLMRLGLSQAQAGYKGTLMHAYQQTKGVKLEDDILSDYYVGLVRAGELAAADDAVGRMESLPIASLTRLRISNPRAPYETPMLGAIAGRRGLALTNQEIEFIVSHLGELVRGGKEQAAFAIASEAGTFRNEKGLYYQQIAVAMTQVKGFDAAEHWAKQQSEEVRAYCLLGAVQGWITQKGE